MTKITNVHAAHAPTPARDVAARRTPASPDRIRNAIATAYRKQTGAHAGATLLDVLTAHVSHETARGERMFNYNFGGIKGAGPGGTTARYATREVNPDGSDRVLVDGFRAYLSLDDGANDYVATMRSRYPAAVAAAARGDVDGFAAALKQRGYFTAHLDDYARAVRSLARDGAASGQVASDVPPDLPPVFAPPFVPPSDAASPFATEAVVGRVLNAMAEIGARVAAPLDDDERYRSQGIR
jgi:hypothetical protein